jgi:uncharacterized Zn finger protein
LSVKAYTTTSYSSASYQRLVEHLLCESRFDDAERWILEGINKADAKWPGIAEALRKCLCELSRRRKKRDLVAAHAAHAFFERPSVRGFQELAAAAGNRPRFMEILDTLEGRTILQTQRSRRSR